MQFDQEAIQARVAFLTQHKTQFMPSSREAMLIRAKIEGLNAVLNSPALVPADPVQLKGH